MFDATRCNACGDCFVQCPYTAYSRPQAIAMVRALQQGNPADILSSCITCMACNEFCERGANPYDLVCAMQEQHGVRLIPASALDAIEATAAAEDSEIVSGHPDAPALSLCVMGSALPPDITASRMFAGLTVVRGGEYYSGIVSLHAGFESRVRAHAPRFVAAHARLNRREIVFLHNDCYVLAATKAPEYGVQVPFIPVHIVAYMTGYLRRHAGAVTPLGMRIAFQRPCISRYIPEEERWLDAFFDVIGVERIGRRYDRRDALCCTVGIAGKTPERAMPIVEKNIADAAEHGAQAMVFLCPTCYRHMQPLCEARGLPALFITELGRMALGEVPAVPRTWDPR
jgi:Fe-S oxidoreductase